MLLSPYFYSGNLLLGYCYIKKILLLYLWWRTGVDIFNCFQRGQLPGLLSECYLFLVVMVYSGDGDGDGDGDANFARSLTRKTFL